MEVSYKISFWSKTICSKKIIIKQPGILIICKKFKNSIVSFNFDCFFGKKFDHVESKRECDDKVKKCDHSYSFQYLNFFLKTNKYEH